MFYERPGEQYMYDVVFTKAWVAFPYERPTINSIFYCIFFHFAYQPSCETALFVHHWHAPAEASMWTTHRQARTEAIQSTFSCKGVFA